MTPATKNWIIAVLIVIVLTGIWLWGFYTFPKRHPPPVITSGTTLVHDTTHHYIYSIWPWYYERIDTVITGTVPPDVDTAAILTAFYSTYQYTRELRDSNLFVSWQDNISQNKAMPVDGFRYELLKPQTVIQNITNETVYNKYLLFGLNVPVYPFKSNTISNINYVALEGLFAYPKGYLRLGWQPYTNIFTFGTGINIFKFK